jgi:ferrochelatase
VALKERLPERGVEIPIYLGNRHSEPYFADVLTQMHKDGHRKVLAWVTSAYSSYSGCRQYRENLAQALTVSELEGKMTIDKVRHYFDHPGFLAPIIEDLNKAMGRLAAKGIATADTIVMFATHSIPESMGESSGPPGVREGFEKPGGTYAAQHLAAATLAMAGLSEQENLPSWELVYQSRSGSPSVPWLEPDVNDAIRTAKDAGKKAIVIVPIGFVSDHVEVIWDLDNEAKETCDELGLEFERVATSGTHSAFVEGIIDLIQERTDGLEAKALSPLGPWPSFCNPNCCPNLRKTLPVIAEG